MNKTYSLDGVEAILAYPFKVAGWQSKFLIGAALFFASYIIPILPSIALLGYCAKIMRDMIVDNADPSLPEWEDWGILFSRGFKIFAAIFVYMLPMITLLVGGYALMIAPAFLVPFLEGAGREASISLFAFVMLGTFGGMFLFLIGFVIGMPLMLLLPPAIGHVVAKDSFAAAFRIKEWWAIVRANLWGFFTAIVIVSGVYFILIMLIYMLYYTIILCILVPILLGVVTMYISIIAAATIAEAYRKGVENLTLATSN